MLRGAGEVGCAHCKTIGADRPCQVCTRLVCETCAADWAIRFASDDHVLISADSDHRVVLRPRTTAGYARALIALSVDGA